MASVPELYRQHLGETRRERLFLASVGFFVTFLVTRLITHAIRRGQGPFRNVAMGGAHVHHLVWGILLLLGVGYLWLVQVGTGERDASPWIGRACCLLYAAGSALTLDEFALWLNLRDVYWAHEGRASIDAVVLFGAVVSAGWWGGPFLHAVAYEWTRVVRRRIRGPS